MKIHIFTEEGSIKNVFDTILPKIETSLKIAPFMNVENNKSKSFYHTICAIKKLAEI
jgi:hypothetical protein